MVSACVELVHRLYINQTLRQVFTVVGVYRLHMCASTLCYLRCVDSLCIRDG